ncbi:hypothetical protein RDWZM_008523, partial [Blomia tropicalis]
CQHKNSPIDAAMFGRVQRGLPIGVPITGSSTSIFFPPLPVPSPHTIERICIPYGF